MMKVMLLMLLFTSTQIHILLLMTRFLPMDIVNDEMKSLCKLHKLDMLHSNGRNAKILYTLK